MTVSIVGFLAKVDRLILNPLIVLAFSVALLVFFWGMVQFITSETADAKRGEGQKKMIYGLLGMVIMLAAKGLVAFVLSIFSIPPTYPL